MSGRVVRLGTRRSPLARTQSRLVAGALEAAAAARGEDLRVELVDVTTQGDVSTAPLASFGGVGVFVSALRDALLAKEVDLAVHSLKDLPTAPADGLVLAAVPPREDPRDVLVARDGATLGELPAGARIGTGSPRRAAQLRALGLGLEVVGVRGNVDSRLGLVTSGEVDAVVLARAGLLRLGRAQEATEVLDPIVMLPAPGQGALAVECREADGDLVAFVGLLDDAPSRAAVEAERTLLAVLEAGCAAPLGALAELVEGHPDDGDVDELSLRAVVASLDGAVTVRRSMTGPARDPVGVGRRLAAVLLEDGAADLVPSRTSRQAGEGDL
jgi:hydroxymethylbilane synthase